ncbi:CDP-alcohol phosphatidyltransferase family protein [Oceanihabitans sediminis]|uniref:CDP-alcohol phosphatidyltransferase family protein n=1 Tax=Oceanihabitans sediminis TaxID=1812012 RepID=UPI00299DCD21|nr:CDP-alcohol phosphatidyltransferase family protein [Oceanihabitans sediminis]MDX1279477.1 CDP-alcohol phosphatidyltransferase family protein [Oceanihabitans sediminis]MDX1774852.1 CDP-alcohol phosphatidyltransferase family protein [Oceanihabitans sediminis]
MRLKRFIPNLITLLNLFCGSIAVILAVENNFVYAAFFVILGIFFDFFDGFFARKLQVQSELGVQLDSLADMVTSGLVPGIIMYKLLALASTSPEPNVGSWDSFMTLGDTEVVPLAFVGLLITLGSAYRLAKFNIDEEQQSFFKGLPTPANALVIISFPLILEFQNSDAMHAIILNTWFLLGITLLSTYILNSPVKLFALKFKNYGFQDNAVRYIFLILSLVLLVVLQFAAIPLIILTYIILSLFSK